MKLVGELKNKVERTENLEEAKKIIEDAGMQLSDEEMNQIAGGIKMPDDLGRIKGTGIFG